MRQGSQCLPSARRPGIPLVRSIRYLRGGAVVAIRLQGRTPEQIETDMVDGVLAANRLGGEAARRIRATLLGAVHPEAGAAAA